MHSRHGATEREGAHKGRIKRDSESANKRTVGQTQLLCINRKRQSKKHQGEGSFHGDTHSLRAGIGFSNISSAPALPASAKGTRLARARATRRPHGRHQQPRSLGDVCLNPLARSYSQHHTTQSPRRADESTSKNSTKHVGLKFYMPAKSREVVLLGKKCKMKFSEDKKMEGTKCRWKTHSGRESCKDKTFCLRHGVLSGFVFQRRSPGDTTLSELRQPEVLFKVGTISYNWSTIGWEEHGSRAG